MPFDFSINAKRFLAMFQRPLYSDSGCQSLGGVMLLLRLEWPPLSDIIEPLLETKICMKFRFLSCLEIRQIFCG